MVAGATALLALAVMLTIMYLGERSAGNTAQMLFRADVLDVYKRQLEGEIVKKVDVNCGYIHRGIEKMCESMTYPQTLALTDRLDYLSAHQNRHALCTVSYTHLYAQLLSAHLITVTDLESSRTIYLNLQI